MHKMAMNVGRRPSIEDGTDMTVEVHILHAYSTFNFRGKHLRVISTGYIRYAAKDSLQPACMTPCWETSGLLGMGMTVEVHPDHSPYFTGMRYLQLPCQASQSHQHRPTSHVDHNSS